VGPSPGTILAVGGGNRPDIFVRFIDAAGGPDSRIIYIPTAGMTPPGEPSLTRSDGDTTLPVLQAAGARNIRILHSFDREVVDSEEFVEPLKEAKAVWFSGGRPERITNLYAGTRTERELLNLLSRGGIIGGTSAGAVVLGSDFVSNSMSEIPLEDRAVQKGFAFLRNVAVQPHSRGAQPRTWTLKRPELLGIAMDEVTGWMIHGNLAEVVGSGNAYVFEIKGAGATPVTLQPGDQYDLVTHTIRRSNSR
jgi:cyanophycinase